MTAHNLSISTRTKMRNFVKWSQKDKCLLCSYQIRLHIHHIIAVDDCGPEHHFNLVALCPNHHYLVEYIKRHVTRKDNTNLKKNLNALEIYNSLEDGTKDILDILSKQHPLSEAIKTIKKIPKELIDSFVHQLLEADINLLESINRLRPRIFLEPPSLLNLIKGIDNPYERSLLSDINLQQLIDQEASKFNQHVGHSIYVNVITDHMNNLGLPYKAILDDSI